ncbi:MAG: cache domain-containing protein [Desulfobacterales bacterium]|jgi:PAS domain S-box-containing protein
MTIRKKMILILLACTIIPVCFVGVLGYYHARKTLQTLRMEELKSIADLKAKRIEDFFAEQKKHIMIAQQRPTLKKYTSMLAEFSGDFSSPVYGTIRDQLDRSLRIYQPVYDFKNVILANPEGKIVYVLDRSSTRGLLGHAIPELWGKSFADGQNGIRLSDIVASKIEAGRFSMILLALIRSDQGQVVGLVAFETDMAPIYELIQNTTGLGETGETFIVKKNGNQALFLNPLRHDPDAALKRTVVFGERQAICLQEALKGNRGCGVSVDYRGQEVIAAWRYIPSLDWGMVAKIDVSEAFEPVTALRDFVLILAIAVIALSIFVAFIVAKSISDPIQILQMGAEKIGKGNLDHKVATNAKDEIGQLGRTFDQMTERLKAVTASRDELDKEIKERRRVEKELQNSMNAVRERIKELNCLFEISRLVERRGLTLDEILQGIVELIPPAWQYPEITCAKIIIEEQEFGTGNFEETQWMLTRPIVVHAETIGALAVYYLEERPQSDEGPFLKEERNLINAISERIGRIIERNRAQTGLVESEERFRELVEHSLTGISIIQDGRIVYQNPEQERLLGPLPRRVLFEDLEKIHRDDIEKVAQFYQNLIAGQWQYTDTEFRFYTSGKKEDSPADMRWVHCRASRIEYQGKDAILLNIDEVTRAKRLENLLRIQDKMSSLGRVAAGIAHEIRNPLSGINIYLNTLKKLHHRNGSEQKVDQILDQLQSASRKIESVIRRVMDFSKPSEPKLSLINVNESISEAIDLSSVSLRKQGIKVKKKLAEHLPQCHLDSQLMEQVMLNLITNAAEAMKHKEDNKIIVVTSALERDHIQVKVSDSGPGVPRDMREMIFDPFYTTKNDSSGIGLSISHRIITDHGGSLSVFDSELGGAEFRIEIPIK